MTSVTYYFFAPVSNARGHFRSIRLPSPFRFERWSRAKLVKLWRQIEALPKWAIEVRIDECYCIPEHRSVGHVVTGEVVLNSDSGVDGTYRSHKALDAFSETLTPVVQALSLYLCAHVQLVGEYWYTVNGTRIEMFSARTVNYPITETFGAIAPRQIAAVNDFLSRRHIPFKREYIQLAFEHWEQSLRSDVEHIEFLSLVMALEALFNVGQHDVRYRVARSAAVLLGADAEDSRYIFESVKRAYDVRSKLVHTGKAKGLEHVWLWSLRHLVRQAILAFVELDLPKDIVAEGLTAHGFGESGKVRANLGLQRSRNSGAAAVASR